MGEEIEICLACKEDLEGIVRLLSSVFGGKFGGLYRKRYPWLFKNPYLNENDSAVWIATNDGRIVGHLVVCPIDFTVNGERVHGYFDADLAVDPSCRRMGIARKIYERALDECHFILSVSSTDIAGGLEDSMGFVLFKNVPRLFKVLKPEAYLPVGLSRLPGIGLPIKWYFRDRCSKRSTGGVYELNRERDLPLLDDFCAKALSRYDISMCREARFLVWRWLDLPMWSYRILFAREGNRMHGYIVFRSFQRNNRKVGRICDFLVSKETPEWLDKLLGFAVAKLREEGCTAIETYCQASRLLRAIFLKQGFRDQKKIRMDFRVYTSDRKLLDWITNSGHSWFLTCGDVDLDLN